LGSQHDLTIDLANDLAAQANAERVSIIIICLGSDPIEIEPLQSLVSQIPDSDLIQVRGGDFIEGVRSRLRDSVLSVGIPPADPDLARVLQQSAREVGLGPRQRAIVPRRDVEEADPDFQEALSLSMVETGRLRQEEEEEEEEEEDSFELELPREGSMMSPPDGEQFRAVSQVVNEFLEDPERIGALLRRLPGVDVNDPRFRDPDSHGD
jgi:hypothetical protein